MTSEKHALEKGGFNFYIVVTHTQKFLINFRVQSELTQNAKLQSFLIEWTDN